MVCASKVSKLERALGMVTPNTSQLTSHSQNTPAVSRMTRNPKILIISSDTGGGHRSAAAAIVAGVQKFLDGESYPVRVVRAVEESHHLSAKLVSLYNWILRNRQHWMKYYYWFINRFRPETSRFFHK